MILKSYCLVIFILIAAQSFSQHKDPAVLASAGGTSKSASIILEWTLGESFIQTISSPSQLYTQGFHQPLLDIYRIAPTKSSFVTRSTYQIYPNPTTSIINIKPDNIPGQPFSVSLVDVSGKVLLKKDFPVNSSLLKIDVTRFTPGTYFLHMSNNAGTVQEVYKIIKRPIIN